MFPGIAAAQVPTPTSLPRVSLGAGIGVAVPLHGDVNFTPFAWDADVRVAMSRRVLLELAVGEIRHSATMVAQNLPGSSPTGFIARVEQTTTYVQRALQVNVASRWSAGRVRVMAGGGVGMLLYSRRSRLLSSGCTPETSCGSFASSSSHASGSVQGVAGVDVPLSRRIAIYGHGRFIVPMRAPGGSQLRVTAGLRWGFGT